MEVNLMRKQESDYPRVDGLTAALKLTKESEGFDRHCRQGVRHALQIRLLRKAYKRIGFLKMGFRSYLELLATNARIDIGQTLEAFGLHSALTPEEGRQAARLAKGVGIAKRELLAQLGISVAEGFGEPVHVMGRGPNEAALKSVDACEVALAGLHLAPEAAGVLRAVQDAATEKYDEE
jgi:hypothetical protein